MRRYALAAVLVAASASACTARNSTDSATWHHHLGSAHALAGRIWDVENDGLIGEVDLVDRLVEARVVLLGEKHDNADHHRLQARILLALVERGGRPVAAFEMITTEHTEAVTRCLAASCGAGKMATAVAWNEGGWPDWRIYKPVLKVALHAGLPIVPASLPEQTIHAIAMSGDADIDAWLSEEMGFAERADPVTHASIVAELEEAHCGHAPTAMIDGMVLAQRVRDAFMAESLAAAQAGGTAVLIAGTGHVRTDRGTPTYLAALLPRAVVKSVAFLEVEDDLLQPSQYGELSGSERLPFDFVWFTPRSDDVDPCERYREQLKAMGS
jgi:uncharacterized iron-regulated protein